MLKTPETALGFINTISHSKVSVSKVDTFSWNHASATAKFSSFNSIHPVLTYTVEFLYLALKAAPQIKSGPFEI